MAHRLFENQSGTVGGTYRSGPSQNHDGQTRTIFAWGTFVGLTNWNPANDNARVTAVDVANAFPFDTQRGIRIGRGSKDRFSALVSDDLSTLSEFTVRVIGTRHYP